MDNWTLAQEKGRLTIIEILRNPDYSYVWCLKRKKQDIYYPSIFSEMMRRKYFLYGANGLLRMRMDN